MALPKLPSFSNTILKYRWEIPVLLLLLILIGILNRSLFCLPLVLPILLRKRRLHSAERS